MPGSRAFAQDVVVINPGEPVPDADNTTTLPGPPTEEPGRGDLWQRQTAEIDADGTVLADWDGVFEPDLPVTAESQVRDVASGVLYRVHGRPEPQRSLLTGELVQIFARLKYISDQQGDPS